MFILPPAHSPSPPPPLSLSLSPHSLALSHCLPLSPSLLLIRLTRFAWNTRFFAGIGIACIARSCLPPRTFRPSLVASPRRRAVSPAALCLAKTAWSPFPVRSLGVCPGVLRIPLRYLLPPSSSSSFFSFTLLPENWLGKAVVRPIIFLLLSPDPRPHPPRRSVGSSSMTSRVPLPTSAAARTFATTRRTRPW